MRKSLEPEHESTTEDRTKALLNVLRPVHEP